MKRTSVIHSLAVKTAAIIAVTLLFWTGAAIIAGSALAVGLAGSAGTTAQAQETTASYILQALVRDRVHYAYANVEYYKSLLEDIPYDYTITDNGEPILSTATGGEYYASGSRHSVYYEEDTEHFITMTLYATHEQVLQDKGWMGRCVRAVGRWHEHAVARFITGGLCWIAALAALVYLYAAAGYRAGEEQPRCNAIDRIPFDLYTGMITVLVLLAIAFLDYASYTGTLFFFILLLLEVVVAGLVLLGYSMSIATRCKTHTLWHNTLIGRLLRLIGRVFRAIPLIPKTVLCIVGAGILELFLMALWDFDPAGLFTLWMVEKAVVIPLIAWIMLGLKRLQSGAREIAGGNIGYSVPVAGLPSDLRRAADDLNHIGDGLQTAMQARLRSEQFKTELITNVSHDIKTPLTSIVNYVDLLTKEPMPEGPVQEYIDVLQRQSGRLKKLVEDLIEASKASTGNLSVSLAPCRLDVLLEQTLGEYASRTEAAGLEMRLTHPERPLYILADDRHLGRILDNLMSNICKYAMPGTRVYLDFVAAGGQAQITFRNVSRAALRISGDELTERFVRGDSARNTEGSGLGLSIARSLTELQGGSLRIVVDGDLFKVILQFPLTSPPPAAAPEAPAAPQV